MIIKFAHLHKGVGLFTLPPPPTHTPLEQFSSPTHTQHKFCEYNGTKLNVKLVLKFVHYMCIPSTFMATITQTILNIYLTF